MPNTQRFENLLENIQYLGRRLLAVVVHLNDTYLIDERPLQNLPGFPRVIATIKRLKVHTQKFLGVDRVLVVHSGDFLGPSLLSKKLEGRRTMIGLLNKMGVDYCVLGNHEFDYTEKELADHLKQAKLKVVLSNVRAPNTIETAKLAKWPTDQPVIALSGVVSDTVYKGFPDTGWSFEDPFTVLSDFAAHTKDVPFHLVLTHADRGEDRKMREAMRDCPRAYMLGGHDHDIDWIENDDQPLLMKNSANLRTVRVLLLLAGGEMARRELRQSYTSLKEKLGAEPVYPKDSDKLLENLHERDAEVFRAWLDRKDPLYHSPNRELSTVSQTYFTEDEDLPADALVSQMAGMPSHEDMWWWLLQYNDHELADNADTDDVERAMKVIREKDDDCIVCDFSKDTATELDANEKSIRSVPTDFGVFVAECVRRKGNADVAIVNSGSFRCDSFLPTRLLVRNLRDTFLYDDDDPKAIIVFEMDGTLVDALLAHGQTKTNDGAYPQVADARQGPRSKVLVAIAYYLLLGKGPNDTKGPMGGYIEVVGEQLKMTKDQTRLWAQQPPKCSFKIIDAIREYGMQVGYKSVPPAHLAGDPATTFIGLADEFTLLFEKKFPDPDGHYAKWIESFRSLLSSDDPIQDTDLGHARDQIRELIRRLPAVQQYDSLDLRKRSPKGESCSEVIEARKAALRALGSLRARLTTHRSTFKNQVAYNSIFDSAATGIAGYQR